MGAVEGGVHFIQAVQKPPHFKEAKSVSDLDGVVTGKTGHVVAFIIGVGVLIALAFGVELVDQEEEVFFLELLPVQQWRLGDAYHCLFCLPPHLLELPPLVAYLC